MKQPRVRFAACKNQVDEWCVWTIQLNRRGKDKAMVVPPFIGSDNYVRLTEQQAKAIARTLSRLEKA